MEKQHVRTLFDSIAHRYDLLNHLLSAGADIFWRRRAVGHLRDISPKRILDVATGTGDFAIATLKLRPEKVVGVDIAPEMLKRGRSKLQKKGLNAIVNLQHGEAEALPFEAGSFDAAIVAFGARNFNNLAKGIGEMHRVLRTGGKIVVLEFSRPRRFPLKQAYFFYFQNLLPFIGRQISKNKYAYRYLRDSVMSFPDGNDFLTVLERAGFVGTVEDRLTFGIATVYSGTKK